MPTLHGVRRALASLAGILALEAAAASAQMFPHGMKPPPRPLHVRLELADVVALGTVERVEMGRIAMADAVPLRGAPGPRFQIKRSPSKAPDLSPGDRVLLLLLGARDPYVLVDEPRELIVLDDPAHSERWEHELGRLVRAADDPARQREIYLSWLDGELQELRAAAVRAFAERTGAALAVTPEVALERAEVALDPERTAAARRASASVACADGSGLRRLLAAVHEPHVDPGVVQIALAAGVLARAAGFRAALLAALAHRNAEVRLAAIPLAAARVADPDVRRRLQELADDESQPELSRRAADVLHRYRPRPGRDPGL